MSLAAALFILVPIGLIHVAVRRRRGALAFQLALDVALLLLPGRILLSGAHLGPGMAGAQPWGAPVTVAGSPEQSDLPLQFGVWWEEVRRLAREGQPPWISDRIGGGAPLFAAGQSGLPFPLQLPVWLLGASDGTDVMAVWKLEAAALGGFLLLFRFGVRPAAAAVGSLAFAFGLYSLSWLVVPLAWIVAATPWAWRALVGTLRGRGSEAAFLAVLLGVLAGWSVHPESAAFLWLAVGVGGVVLAWGRWRRLRRLLAPFACALAVAAIGALPTIATIAGSSRSAAVLAGPIYPGEGVDWSMRAHTMALALTPWRDGSPVDGSWIWPFPAAAVAVSVGAAAVALAVGARPRRRHARLALALATIGCLAGIMVWQIPGPAHLLARMAVIGLLNWSRAGFLLGFAVAGLAGLACDAWLRRPGRTGLVAAAAAVQLALILLLVTSSVPGSSARSWRAAGAPAVLALLAPAGAALGGWPVAATVLAEEVAQGWDVLPASRSASGVSPIAVALRRGIDEDGGRILGLGDALPANLAARWGASDLRSHDPVRPIDLARLHRALGAVGSDLPGPITRPWAGLAGAWGVRWLVAPSEGLHGQISASWSEVYHGEDGRLYRNSRALPVIRVASRTVDPPGRAAEGAWEGIDFAETAVVDERLPVNGTGSLVVLSNRPSSVAVQVRVSGDVLVVLHVPRAPGWRASVDGLPSRIVTADLAAMGVVVQAGVHEVRWEYRPPGLWLGVALTLGGLAGCAWLARRPRRRQE